MHIVIEREREREGGGGERKRFALFGSHSAKTETTRSPTTITSRLAGQLLLTRSVSYFPFEASIVWLMTIIINSWASLLLVCIMECPNRMSGEIPIWP